MSALNTFIQEIEGRKKREISTLNASLNEVKSKISKTKEESLKAIEEKYSNESKVKSQRESARISESARLQAKKILFDAINANMDSTFGKIKSELSDYTKKSEYRVILENMVNYAKRYLGEDIVIQCRAEDVDILKDMKVKIGSPIPTIGGILSTDVHNTKEIDMTFEELLRNHEDDIRGFLIKKMVNQ